MLIVLTKLTASALPPALEPFSFVLTVECISTGARLEFFFSFTQHPFAIPYDPALKCLNGTVRTNLSFVAVALHQFECAVATSHREAKLARAHPNSSFSFHAGQSFSR